MGYMYVTDNNLYHKQNYMYSEYGGKQFLMEYVDSRRRILSVNLDGFDDDYVFTTKSETGNILKDLLAKLKDGCLGDELVEAIDAYTKSFEVRKRIYTAYDERWKPMGDAGFEDYELYVLFADCLLQIYGGTQCLKYFSCLLKVNDTILSVFDELNVSLQRHAASIIDAEVSVFHKLANKIGIDLEVGI